MLRPPSNNLGRHWDLDLPALVGPNFESACAHLTATRLRAALVAFPEWPGVALRLQAVMAQHATLAEMGAGQWWPSGWDAPPYVAHLSEAAGAFEAKPAERRWVAPGFEELFVSARPQADAARRATAALAPARLLQAMGLPRGLS